MKYDDKVQLHINYDMSDYQLTQADINEFLATIPDDAYAEDFDSQPTARDLELEITCLKNNVKDLQTMLQAAYEDVVEKNREISQLKQKVEDLEQLANVKDNTINF